MLGGTSGGMGRLGRTSGHMKELGVTIGQVEELEGRSQISISLVRSNNPEADCSLPSIARV